MADQDDPPVVVYRYSASPFAQKIDHVLTLKRIPHHTVKVNYVLPRPELSELLGIAYRRIPVLAIGSDVYCDTSLIALTLERRFPASKGFDTIFPRRKGSGKTDANIIHVFSKYYIEAGLFPTAFKLIQWDRMRPSFIKDRSGFRGEDLDVQAMVSNRSQFQSVLVSHLKLINQQLMDGREWLFDTELPSLADVSVYFMLSWVRTLPVKDLFHGKDYLHVLDWLSRMDAVLKERSTPSLIRPITGVEAAKLISSSPCEAPSVVGFDIVEAARLGVTVGSFVAITPEDTGTTHPTFGVLIGLNKDEFVIRTKGSIAAVRCHFPRLGYAIRSARESESQCKL